MANHGGRTAPLARTHRPRAPIMSVPAPLTAPLAPLRPAAATLHQAATNTTTIPTTPVTLTAPRPDAERTANEYVETPFRGSAPPVAPFTADKAIIQPVAARIDRPARLLLPLPAHSTTAVAAHLGAAPPPSATVTKQPIAFTKEHPAVASAGGHTPVGGHSPGGDCPSAGGIGGGNIMCPQCGRCRCESCKRPRALPQRWVCDNACLCSADAVIDYASCLCCVKGLYYHCSESDAGATCADDPCSCGPSRRLARWGCLSALAAVLPCLLCYWPLRACQRAVEAAYARHSRAGCRCPCPHASAASAISSPASAAARNALGIAPSAFHHRPHAATPEKRLLDSSPDF